MEESLLRAMDGDPRLASGANCGIGRTGHVYFDDLSKSEGMLSSWLSR